MRFQHVQALRAQLRLRHAAALVNSCLAALRGVLKAAVALDQMTERDYRKCLDAARRVKSEGLTQAAGRAISQDEFARLLDTARQTNWRSGANSARNVALLTLLWCPPG